MQLIMTTDGLPSGERFDGWLNHMTRLVAPAPTHFSSEHRSDFRGRIEAMDLGAIQVTAHVTAECEAFRTSRLIRQSDPELLNLLFVQDGPIGLAQDGKDAILRPFDMTLFHTSRPYHMRTGTKRSHHALTLSFPGSLLPFSGRALKQAAVHVLPGTQGIGRLTAQFLSGLAAHRGPHSTADLLWLGITLTDLITMLLGHRLDTAVPPETGRRALLMRVRDHIQRNLGDPTLSPTTIAAAHSMSLRSLHRLFTSEGTTVAGWIREQRLERGRHDLVRPGQREAIHVIANRWGFSDVAVFSRAFRAAYGMNPQEYRSRHLADPAG
ncbi:helix-turn-helix domain-containing protein [Nonomuraea jiangxiensis]|uniref:AraC-type DNA-binding protein n=1 Tax=Nonomuraea jiangxiensis TaxID=633440 RepID=A0A1G9SRQ4_9ACTN|nr:helix-turn-helix domain-containing protein [Nonomuraea jiangxiensis]SDM38093.1 AraC-type DNA-binding protein [Nonomuraea jiangxiensis]